MSKGDELTPFQASMLYRLVDARYVRGKPTIVTVNVNDDAEGDRRMGEATWDRLCHDSWKVFCDWPTHRKPAREIG
jgi:DNA replication protein DnaC